MAEKKKKKKGLTDNQKGWLTFGSIAIIGVAGGAYLLLLESAEEKIAAELAIEIEQFKGAGINDKMSKVYGAAADEIFGSTPENEEMKTIFLQATSMGKAEVTWDSLTPAATTDFGAVDLKNVKLTSNYEAEKTEGFEAVPGERHEDLYDNVRIKKSADNPNNYLFEIDKGVNKKFSVASDGAAPATPYMLSKITGSTGNVEFTPEGTLRALSSNVAALDLRDGSDSLSYVLIENLQAAFMRESGETNKFAVTLAAEKITPGDTFKFLLGPIDNIGFALDFGYEGDNISELSKISESFGSDLSKILAADKSQELLAKISAAEKFNGQFKLNKFALTTGDKGLEASSDLTFANFPAAPMPKGEVKFTIKNYPELIKLVQTFAPIPQAEIDADIKDAEEFFVNDGKNLTFQATLDGTKIVKLSNGKQIDVLEKFADSQADLPALAPEPVESTELPTEKSE